MSHWSCALVLVCFQPIAFRSCSSVLSSANEITVTLLVLIPTRGMRRMTKKAELLPGQWTSLFDRSRAAGAATCGEKGGQLRVALAHWYWSGGESERASKVPHPSDVRTDGPRPTMSTIQLWRSSPSRGCSTASARRRRSLRESIRRSSRPFGPITSPSPRLVLTPYIESAAAPFRPPADGSAGRWCRRRPSRRRRPAHADTPRTPNSRLIGRTGSRASKNAHTHTRGCCKCVVLTRSSRGFVCHLGVKHELMGVDLLRNGMVLYTFFLQRKLRVLMTSLVARHFLAGGWTHPWLHLVRLAELGYWATQRGNKFVQVWLPAWEAAASPCVWHFWDTFLEAVSRASRRLLPADNNFVCSLRFLISLFLKYTERNSIFQRVTHFLTKKYLSAFFNKKGTFWCRKKYDKSITKKYCDAFIYLAI